MANRQPLSTLPISDFVAVSSTTSPTKRSRLSALKMSASNLNSLLPSPFLAPAPSTTTASTGPLSTIYDRRGVAIEASPRSRSRSQSTRREGLNDEDDFAPTQEEELATPPRRLLDLFVQSAERDQKNKSPARRSNRSGSTNPSPASRSERVATQDDAPAFEFFHDDDDEAEADSSTSSTPSGQPAIDPTLTVEGGEDDSSSDPSKENARPPVIVASTTTRMNAPVEPHSAPSSLPPSTNPSPSRLLHPSHSLPILSLPPAPVQLQREENLPRTPDQPHPAPASNPISTRLQSPMYPNSFPSSATAFPFDVSTESERIEGTFFGESGHCDSFEGERRKSEVVVEVEKEEKRNKKRPSLTEGEESDQHASKRRRSTTPGAIVIPE